MKSEQHISQIMLERFVLGELDKERTAWLNSRIELDSNLRARVDEIQQHNRDYLQAHPVDIAYQHCTDSISKVRSSTLVQPILFPRYLSAAVAMLVVAVLFLPQLSIFNSEISQDNIVVSEDGDIRLKGIEPRLNVYKKMDRELQKLGNNGHAKSNEILQLSYIAGERPYGAILSIDGRGSVTLHFPENIDGSIRLASDGEKRLDHAYQLDDAPDFERFFFITAGHEFKVTDILLAAQELARDRKQLRTGKLPLEETLQQKSVAILKE